MAARRGYREGFVEVVLGETLSRVTGSKGHGGTPAPLSAEKRRANMCFCETNRIGFGMKTGDNILSWNWMRSKRVEISIRFVWNGLAVCDAFIFQADKLGGVCYT
jgi:hypothetical protein